MGEWEGYLNTEEPQFQLLEDLIPSLMKSRETKSSYININLVIAWTLEKIRSVRYHVNSLRAARCRNLFSNLNKKSKNQISFLEHVYLSPGQYNCRERAPISFCPPCPFFWREFCLRGLGSHDHFKTVLIFLRRRRVLYKDIKIYKFKYIHFSFTI